MLERKGMLVITTARKADRLVGYVSHFIVPNFHYRSLKVADCDIFWLDPDYRVSRIGLDLLRASERNVRAVGCNKITMKEKIHIPLGRLFAFLGYREIERLHAKTLIGD
jgi:GNAT superfamily N-acetyltransferase